ncbi:MAG: polysaccharide biosynthesis C-terminal domain-containing protein [Taibaiella sp.]|nr:polysaccharide biosynthesis C-terminal domain-containing protein [Taibaiella sp.]
MYTVRKLITVVFTDKYAESIPIFICTLLILPAQFCISLAYVLQFKDKANLINRGAFIDLGLTLILLYPFFRLWGNMGIILSVVVSTYVQSLYYLVHASRALRSRILSLIPWSSYIWKMIIFTLIATGCHYFGDWIFAPSFNLISGTIVGGLVVWYSFRWYRKNEAHSLQP